MDKIQAIDSIDNITLQRVLSSTKLTDNQKAEFIRKNSAEIKNLTKTEISKSEFLQMMRSRPLVRLRPLKNSFTKKGDTILLAEALEIPEKDVKKYINSIIKTNFEIHNTQDKDNIEKVKTYVYRHGTKDQVVRFLEYELSDVKTMLTKLYKTLEDNSGGLADYFSRPIHRMDNNTLRKLYSTIDKSLRNSLNAGYINAEECNSHSQWALVRIYQIQNNSKLIRAYEVYKDLTD